MFIYALNVALSVLTRYGQGRFEHPPLCKTDQVRSQLPRKYFTYYIQENVLHLLTLRIFFRFIL